MSTHNQPAAAARLSAVILKLLDLAADPQQACLFVAEEVLRLSSARCVVLLRICPDGSTDITALPQDRRSLIEQPGVTALFNRVADMTGPAFLQTPDAPPDVAQMLRAERIANCLVVPIMAGDAHHGVLIAFDLDHPENHSAFSGNVDSIARLLALIFGRATLSNESARHLEEQQLRMSSQAVQNAIESIYLLDMDGNILFVNPAAEKELGYSAAELRQMRISDIDPNVPLDIWGKDGDFAIRLRAGEMRHYRTQQRHRDGHMIPVEINSSLFYYDGKEYSIAICNDISQRLAAEESLRASEEKFSAMFSMTPDPMALTRLRDGVLLEISHSYAEYFGYERNEMLGHSTLSDDLGLWIKPAHRQKWRDQLERDGEVLGFETPLRHKDGTVVTVLISGKIVDMSGEHCVIVVLRDITLRKQMEELLLQEKAEQAVLIHKLEEAQNQLLQSEKMASIGQLAAGVAHEINNPVGFVNSNLGSLETYTTKLLQVLAAYEQEERNLPSERCAAMNKLKQELDIAFLKEDIPNLMSESKEGLQRVRRIVADLKDFSHVDESEFQYANLEKCLDSTLNVVWNELKYKAEVIKKYAGIPEIECLPSQLNQVFMNLLVNAAQSIVEHGRITLRTGFDADNLWVEVADTGSGISPENLSRIFEPFFTTKPIGKGTGLGLSLAYGIVHKHGGRIEVNSELGVGSTFRVALPRQPSSGDRENH